MNKKNILKYPKSAAMGFFFQGTQEWVRNSCGTRAISVRAIEVLLYLYKLNSRDSSPIHGASAVKVFVLLFSFSIFSDRWSLKIENENNSMKT